MSLFIPFFDLTGQGLLKCRVLCQTIKCQFIMTSQLIKYHLIPQQRCHNTLVNIFDIISCTITNSYLYFITPYIFTLCRPPKYADPVVSMPHWRPFVLWTDNFQITRMTRRTALFNLFLARLCRHAHRSWVLYRKLLGHQWRNC